LLKIPEIPEIHIPDISIEIQHQANHLDIEVPGCSYQHRDQNLQPQLLVTDPNGVFTTCDGNSGIPSFYPMDWNPKDIKIIEDKLKSSKKQETPKSDKPAIPEIPVECPGPDNLRIGDIRNAESREKVIGHEVVDNKCIEIYSDTTFVDKYIPKISTVSTTFGITIVATSAAALTPTILNKLIKPASKQVINRFKKLIGKKTKVLSVAERKKKQRESRK
tara:strand:+ start:340 stop:996 length:657 start_codon:yes stop_codon:yes gene_type:complete